ncbi:MAG: DUF2059 domain-containing protein [Kiritimatiellae bacterium]|nr:DUF2059 domain-containing protein [Kiritimatiellia bacterium]
MKNLTFILFPVLFLCLPACTTAPHSAARSEKERHAEELMAIVPPEIMFAQLAEPYAHAYALPHKQTKARSNFMRNVDLNEVNRIIREALVKHFTEAELKALATFYSTPAGRSCMAKTAPFAADVVPACSHEATKAFRKTALDAARGALLP